MANVKQDLSAVGKRINALKGGSDAEMLQGIVGLGLDVFQNIYLDKKQETRSDLTRSLSTLEDSIKAIDYTQSEMEIEIDGEMVNLYDRQVELAEENLQNLTALSEDPILSNYSDDISIIIFNNTFWLFWQSYFNTLYLVYITNLSSFTYNNNIILFIIPVLPFFRLI